MALTKIITDTIDLSGDTNALKMPKGTTGERPYIYIDYLIVGGGGSAGAAGGGGAGAGGLITSYGSLSGGGVSAVDPLALTDGTSYSWTVGNGGTGVVHSNQGNNGDDSSFSGGSLTAITAVGGGGSGAGTPIQAGKLGGSGGASGQCCIASGGDGTASQGFKGGSKSVTNGTNYVSPGGGGAGAPGGDLNNDTTPTAGGIGLAVNILNTTNASTASVGEVSGSDVYYAGGGGGSKEQGGGTGAAGGLGGGVQGGYGCPGTAPPAAAANTGGGGGGTGGCGSAFSNAGGSGVIILRYPNTTTATVSGTQSSGSPFTEGSYTITVLTSGSGTISFTDNSLPSATTGMMRENTTTGKMEIYTGVKGWRALQQTDQAAAGIVGTNNFDTSLYVGDAGAGNTQSQTITSLNFQPDLIWAKNRDNANNNVLFDSTRGATNWLNSNNTNQEYSNSYTAGASFLSNGFTTGTSDQTNRQGNNIVAWGWKAGGNSNTFNVDGVGYASAAAAGMNTGTNPPSACSVNTETGFSIVKFIGDGVAGATIDHGLSSSPQLILVKNLDVADNWAVYNSTSGATKYMNLNQTYGVGTATSIWNDTEPTSIVFSVGTSTDVNGSGNDLIAYSFHSVPSYSLIGSYMGTGSSTNTPIIYTGFEPAWIMVKCVDSARAWNITDNKRNTTNPRNNVLQAQSGDIEYNSSTYNINFYNDGFQIGNADTGWNILKETYIFMCFAS